MLACSSPVSLATLVYSPNEVGGCCHLSYRCNNTWMKAL